MVCLPQCRCRASLRPSGRDCHRVKCSETQNCCNPHAEHCGPRLSFLVATLLLIETGLSLREINHARAFAHETWRLNFDRDSKGLADVGNALVPVETMEEKEPFRSHPAETKTTETRLVKGQTSSARAVLAATQPMAMKVKGFMAGSSVFRCPQSCGRLPKKR